MITEGGGVVTWELGIIISWWGIVYQMSEELLRIKKIFAYFSVVI